jgi:hypothetical protein
MDASNEGYCVSLKDHEALQRIREVLASGMTAAYQRRTIQEIIEDLDYPEGRPGIAIEVDGRRVR